MNLTKQLNRIIKDYVSVQKKSSSNYESFLKRQSPHFIALLGIARYQFGSISEMLLDGCTIKGRYPNFKFYRSGEQLGMLTGERGMISLTLPGAILAMELCAGKEDADYTIIIDDFVPMGSIMSVGIKKASKNIRTGDEVIACFNGSVRAVGRAEISGPEMETSNRGIAVKVRHHV